MNEEKLYNEEVYHVGQEDEEPRNPHYMDPESGEIVRNNASTTPSQKVVSAYLKRCNVNHQDEDEKNKDVNYDGLSSTEE